MSNAVVTGIAIRDYFGIVFHSSIKPIYAGLSDHYSATTTRNNHPVEKTNRSA